MKLILLSGGSGKRLWPLSNDVRSKQFLKVVQNEKGKIESMVQRVYRQMNEAKLNAAITIATSAAQAESIKSQLGDRVSVVIEPERRNTFPAIVLSAAFLYYEKNVPSDETIVVLPVDPYVDSGYFAKIHELDRAVQNNAGDIVLMGVEPTYPSEKYGYIIPEDRGGDVMRVAEFKEKPDVNTAEGFISRGALWNCGVFAFKLSYLIENLREIISFDSFGDVERQYGKLEKTSFDYAVVEKAKRVAAVPYSGEWKDLGTWNTLTEVMSQKPIGDVKLSEDCENTHVINELDVPVIVMGAKNMVVAAGHDGILVADKEQSSYIKQYVEDMDRRPMYEERGYGEYKVLDLVIGRDGTKSLTKRKTVKAGSCIEYQRHRNRSEIWAVIGGKCIITVNDRAHEALAGDTFSIGEGVMHGLKAITDTEIIEIQVGKELIADGTEVGEDKHAEWLMEK
ncbi:MAG: sugar phosphate nucleotidyltransferase [Ruminococcus sp.]|nr:sugar phosphate nucleotidyltransferase [Ruminococcus sp.]